MKTNLCILEGVIQVSFRGFKCQNTLTGISTLHRVFNVSDINKYGDHILKLEILKTLTFMYKCRFETIGMAKYSKMIKFQKII